MEILRMVELSQCSHRNWAWDSRCDCEQESCEFEPES